MKKIDAIYIHIPFCKEICNYCDFCKIYYQKELADKYLNAIEQDVNTLYQKEKIKTIYVGGGTPSVLNRKQFARLFSILKKIKLQDTYEFTVEVNVENLDEEKIKIMKNNGVNRVSLGVETINESYRKELGRKGKKKNIITTIDLLKKYDLKNINVDLMYGFHNQTEKELKKDLEFILKLEVPHLSVYSLIVEKNTILGINCYQRLDDDTDYTFYQLIDKVLKKNGYIHYEISNYAKKGYESWHNLNYWNNNCYYGFGASAAGYIENKRYRNTSSVSKYINGKREVEEELLTEKEQMDYEIILNLRKKQGISKKKFFEKYHKKIEEVYSYQNLIEKKILGENKNYLYVKDKYRYVLNEILIKILN